MAAGVASSPLLLPDEGTFGGEGVDMGAEDAAVVCDEADGTLRARPGVEKADVSEESERSGTVPADCTDVSARPFKAADIPRTDVPY